MGINYNLFIDFARLNGIRETEESEGTIVLILEELVDSKLANWRLIFFLINSIHSISKKVYI